MISHRFGVLLEVTSRATIAIIVCFLLMILILNPLWILLDLHVPERNEQKVDFTSPVDAIFYIENAELGYRWSASTPTSLWFHPLIAWLIKWAPLDMEGNYKFLLISLLAGLLALVITHQYINLIAPTHVNSWWLLLIVLIPGGISISTSNAEFTCLLFTSLLFVSVIRKSKPAYPILWGSLSILSKPNALYMIPPLIIYFLYALSKKDTKLARNSILGATSILICWALWIGYVDYNAGKIGTYWSVRQMGSSPLTIGVFSYFQSTARVLVHTSNAAEKLRYLLAIIIPGVHIILLQALKLKNEIHRLAILTSIISMFFITILINNPNKIIVYNMTVPSTLAIGILFLRQTLAKSTEKESKAEYSVRLCAGISYVLFCVLMFLYFTFGTPLSWYY